jgi:2-alkyl-3-oxoalkanoate reductase
MSAPVIVIGSDDFVGRRIAARLGTSVSRVSATDASQLAAALAGCSAVVNNMTGAAARLRQNAEALAHAVAACGNPALRVVHLSSMAVYGSATGTVNEDTPLLGDLGDYSSARVAAEHSLRAVADRVTVLRLGVDYGAGGSQWTVRIARLLRQRRLGDMGVAGDGTCNLVHVDDIALAVERALQTETAAGCAFNLAMSAPPLWNEYLTRFAIALHAVPVRRITARRRKIESKLLAPPLKVLEILGGRLRIPGRMLPPPIPGSLLRTLAHDIRLDSRRAENLLGMQWMSLDAGLREALAGGSC